ncbi:hypothetical protein V6N13_070528 [Hibiscus sabdariffa]
MTEGETRHALLVAVAYGLIEIEVVGCPEEYVVEPGANQARDRQLEELGESVGDRGHEPADEQHEDHNPFEHRVDEELGDRPEFFLYELLKRSFPHIEQQKVICGLTEQRSSSSRFYPIVSFDVRREIMTGLAQRRPIS